MRSPLRLCIAIAAGLVPGCSGPSTPADQLPTATTYAQGVKQDIHDLVNNARNKPKVAKQQAGVLLEKLETYEKQPIGDHGPIFANLLTKTKELAEKERSAADANRILNEMLKLANQLPGQVQVQRPSTHLAPSRLPPGSSPTVARLARDASSGLG